jgi:hypothetical protein
MIRERIIQFIDYKGISKYKFYQDTGFSNGFLDKEGAIGSDKCEKISYVYPDINLEWLITGNGEMINEGPKSYLEKRRSIKSSQKKIGAGKITITAGVPIYDIPIDASFLERYNDDGPYYEPIGFLDIPRLRNCNFIARVSGNSMYPILKSGGYVACRIVQDFSYFEEGEMYFVSTRNGFETVKYVQTGDNADELKLIPHNEKIKASVIKKEIVLKMCIVEGWISFR